MQCKYIHQVCNLPFIFIYLFGRVTELYVSIWPQNTLLGASNYLFKNN